MFWSAVMWPGLASGSSPTRDEPEDFLHPRPDVRERLRLVGGATRLGRLEGAKPPPIERTQREMVRCSRRVREVFAADNGGARIDFAAGSSVSVRQPGF